MRDSAKKDFTENRPKRFWLPAYHATKNATYGNFQKKTPA